jgi:hypothetical protein
MKRTLTISKSAIESAHRQALAAGDQKAIAAAQRLLGLIRNAHESGYDRVRITS